MPDVKSLVECACGRVGIELEGRHIYCASCHCDDCQAAAEQMQKLPSAAPILDPYRGTAFVLHRKDRYRIVRGGDQIKAFKLQQDSRTSRMIATCCNSPLFLSFDNSQHWISVYLIRFGTHAPSVKARIATKFISEKTELPAFPPSYKTFPFKMIAALLGSRVLMAIGK